MYFGFKPTPAEFERCRRLLVAHRNGLESVPFSQSKLGARGVDGDDKLSVLFAGDYILVPGLDQAGHKSVLVCKKRQ
jgi:hypothetical protein